MIQNLVRFTQRQSPFFDLQNLAPQCAWPRCIRSGARWTALLRRREGMSFEGHWYCGLDCLQLAVEGRLQRLLADRPLNVQPARHRMSLGLILLSRGIIRHDQLHAALQAQRQSSLLFGECLRQLNFATEDQVTAALATQWGCPVYPANRETRCHHIVPHLLQEEHHVIPLHWVEPTRDLYMAFTQQIDHTVLYSVGNMLDCHTQPCVVNQSVIERHLPRPRSSSDGREVVIIARSTLPEMVRTVVSYAQQTDSESIRTIACGLYIWVRLLGAHGPFDLFFRRCPA